MCSGRISAIYMLNIAHSSRMSFEGHSSCQKLVGPECPFKWLLLFSFWNEASAQSQVFCGRSSLCGRSAYLKTE
jgi:hypothetical protein